MDQVKEEQSFQELAQVIGEVILAGSLLDQHMNRICESLFLPPDTTMGRSIIATLDPARKVEMLKARAKKIRAGDWKTGLLKHVEKIERVNRARNIAGHSYPKQTAAGDWALATDAAAKLMNSIDLEKGEAKLTDLQFLKSAIDLARDVLADGVSIEANLKLFAAKANDTVRIPKEIRASLDTFASEENIDSHEALRRILRDWLIGHGYLPLTQDLAQRGGDPFAS